MGGPCTVVYHVQCRGRPGLAEVPVRWGPMHHGYWSHGNPVCEQNDEPNENITFLQLHWQVVKIGKNACINQNIRWYITIN